MSLDVLRTLAIDAAAALDAQPNITEWPDLLASLLQELRALAADKGVDSEDFASQLELMPDQDACIGFTATEAPTLMGASATTAEELAAWAATPGAGFLYGSGRTITCLEGAAWPLDAFTTGGLDAKQYLASPSVGPHTVVSTLIDEGFIYDDNAPTIDDLTVGQWGMVRAGERESQWLILTDEYREQAILAAPHLATDARPLPIFWCDWMDEIGLRYLGGTTREALHTLLRRGIEALVGDVAELLGHTKYELRGLLTT